MRVYSSKTISVRDILRQCSGWGVPHFQRGSVWSTDNISRLLESLYHDTPCGSIILWKQHRPEFGVPLVAGEKESGFSYLIVDGQQQRTRSLIAAFDGCSLNAGEVCDGGVPSGIPIEDNVTQESDVEGEGSPAVESQSQESTRKYWSINLDRVPEFREILNPNAKALQAPLFVLVEDLVGIQRVEGKAAGRSHCEGEEAAIPF